MQGTIQVVMVGQRRLRREILYSRSTFCARRSFFLHIRSTSTRKRMASVSTMAVNTTPILAPTFESRRRCGHVLIFETMRECAEKREVARKTFSMCLPFASFSSPDARALTINTQEAPAPTVHNTHGRFSKLPILSPAKLRHMKSEKEAQEMLSRQRAEGAQQQQLV